MADRIVEWTDTASRQRRAIMVYWTRRNGSTAFAKKIISISAQYCETIARHPYIFKKSEYPDTRVAAMGHFSILYKVTEKKIFITAFWDNRQDPRELAKLFSP